MKRYYSKEVVLFFHIFQLVLWSTKYSSSPIIIETRSCTFTPLHLPAAQMPTKSPDLSHSFHFLTVRNRESTVTSQYYSFLHVMQ